MNNDAVKLIPCPFCGSSNIMLYHEIDVGHDSHPAAQCKDCEAVGPAECWLREEHNEPTASELWNTRAPTPREQELEAELQQEREAARGLMEAVKPLASFTDNEGTRAPYWLIIDPIQMMQPDCHRVATMVTGPFFSREAAQSHLDARRYAYSKRAVVYCHTAHWSREYCQLQEAAIATYNDNRKPKA